MPAIFLSVKLGRMSRRCLVCSGGSVLVSAPMAAERGVCSWVRAGIGMGTFGWNRLTDIAGSDMSSRVSAGPVTAQAGRPSN
jgi:hypothetical protein